MADRPILFSGPMVRALLAGTKTQTRRTINSARVFATPESKAFTLSGDSLARALQNASRFRRIDGNGWFWEADAFDWQAPSERTGWMAHIGYAPGDRLYVREHWRTGGQHDHIAPRDLPQEWAEPIGYIADEAPNTISRTGRFRQGMHMPRWASRITLTVTDVRVERLQDIIEADAIAEGIEDVTREVASGDPSLRFWKRYRDGGWNGYVDTAIGSYASLWTEINGPGSWEVNPWVAAYSFTVALGNIDSAA